MMYILTDKTPQDCEVLSFLFILYIDKFRDINQILKDYGTDF